MSKLREKQGNNFEAYQVYDEKLFPQFDKVGCHFYLRIHHVV